MTQQPWLCSVKQHLLFLYVPSSFPKYYIPKSPGSFFLVPSPRAKEPITFLSLENKTCLYPIRKLCQSVWLRVGGKMLSKRMHLPSFYPLLPHWVPLAAHKAEISQGGPRIMGIWDAFKNNFAWSWSIFIALLMPIIHIGS